MHKKYSSTQSLIGLEPIDANIFRNAAAEHVWENRAHHFFSARNGLVERTNDLKPIEGFLHFYCRFFTAQLHGYYWSEVIMGKRWGV